MSWAAYRTSVAGCARGMPELLTPIIPGTWPTIAQRSALLLAMAEVRGTAPSAMRQRIWAALVGVTDLERVDIDTDADAASPPDRAAILAAHRHLADCSAEIDRAVAVASAPAGASVEDLAQAAAVLLCAGVVRAPVMLAASVGRWVVRTAPPAPRVVGPRHGRAGLLAHVLAETLPALVSVPVVRHLVGRLPGAVQIGVRSGRTTATLVIGPDVVRVRDGIGRHVAIVIDGIEPLLRRVAAGLDAEVAALDA